MSPCARIEYGYICYGKQYRYQGYYFEWNNFCGPTPLRKNGEISKQIPNGFWDMINNFQALSFEDKEKYREL